jgi:hypothetical protein
VLASAALCRCSPTSSLQKLARTDPAGGRPGTAPMARDGRRCWEWLEKMNRRIRK